MKCVMRIAFLFLPLILLGQSLCMGDMSPRSPCSGWEALSQLDSLMPERIWEQEFDLIVDKKAFHKAICQWTAKPKIDPSCCILGHSFRYFLKTTMSGDIAQIIDLYEEFEWSPFWRYPPRGVDLRALKQQIK